MLQTIGNRSLIGIWILILGSSPCFGQGQETPGSLYVKETLCGDLQPGARIKFLMYEEPDAETPEGQIKEMTVTGIYQSCGDGELVFKPERSRSDPVHVPLENVQWMQVSQGRSNHFVTGALIGLTAGLVISVASQTRHHEDEFLGGLADMEENVGRGAAITVTSTLIGGMIGGITGGEKWANVYGREWSASLGSGPRGECQVAVGCSF